MSTMLLAKLTLVLATAAGLCLALRGRSAAFRHLVAVLGLSAALALPALVGALPAWDLPIAMLADTPTSGIDRVPASLSPAIDDGPTQWAYQSVPRATRTPTVGPAAETRSVRLDPRDAGLAIWLAGMLWVLLRLGLGWLRMTRVAIDATPLSHGKSWELVDACLDRLGIRSAPRVLVSDDVHVPLLWGFVRPTLFLPPAAVSWPVERLRVVLLHEFAHLKRRDGLTLLIGRVAAAIWWFHPLTWVLERRARRDCEGACDDAVVEAGIRPSDYAKQLLDIAASLTASTPTSAEALSIMGPGQLEKRLESILQPHARRGFHPWVATALIAVVGVVLGTVASAHPVAARARDGIVSSKSVAEDSSGTQRELQPEILLARDERSSAGEFAFQRASELHGEERWEEAIDAFEEAARAGFHEGTSLYNAACGYARLGDASMAVDRLEQAIDAGFDNVDYIAEDSDLDPIRRDPEFKALIERLAAADPFRDLRVDDRLEGALDRYEDLRATGSIDGGAWYEVGSALLRLREFDAAVDALERSSVNLGHGNRNALYNLACAHALAGDNGSALDALEQAVLAGFDSAERFANDSDLAGIRDESRFAEIEELHDTLSLDRFRRGSHWGSQYSARRWEPAVDEMRAFVESHPAIGRGWSNLGWALHHSRRFAEAREAFTRQLDLDYQPGIATYNIACTYAMENQVEPAFDWLGRAVDMESVSGHHLAADDDLQSLHDDPRFEDLLERAIERDQLHNDDQGDDTHEMMERIMKKVKRAIHQS